MALVKWDPFKDILTIQERMSRLFDEALYRYKDCGPSRGVWSPPVDIYETEEKIVLKAELPGIDIKDVDVEVQDNILTLKGERRFEKNLAEEHYHRMECSYGAFERVFNLPDIVDRDRVKATLKDGVLEIIIPKAPATKARPVKVEIE